MFSLFSRFVLWVWGWKASGYYPQNVDKIVVAVAPHTSNWDFPLGVLINSAYRCRANYVGKHTLFRWPFGILFRWWGGIPVDRTKKGNFVSDIVDAFKREKRFHLVISPEGTRTKVDKFKTGFYHIAVGAGVPICLCRLDAEKKEFFFDPVLFHPSGDEKKDLQHIWEYFKKVKGIKPEQGIL